jgi:hypothetical protein
MKVLLHPIPGKYLERLNEPDKGHIKTALKGLEKEPPEGEPLLAFIVEDYWKPVIESASPEEISIAEERIKDYKRDPSSFISLDSIK